MAACLIGVLLLAVPSVVTAQTEASRYRIARRIGVEGEGSFDLLAADGATGRLFLSHGTVVQVVDLKTGKLLGVIPDANGVHGIALDRDANKGFVTCGKDNNVAIFDLTTLKVLARVPVTGTNPDAIVCEPVSRHVFAFNGRSNDATVIDAESNEVLGTVALGGKPELGVCDASGTVFVNLEDKSMVDAIDARTLKVVHEWPIAPGEEPTGLAIDTANHRLFIGCHNRLMVVASSEDGKVITTLPIGERVDGVGFDAGLRRACSSNGDGTLTVVQESEQDSFGVLENVATQTGCKTLAIDEGTHHIYLPTAEFGEAPAPTAENPRPRPTIKPGSFVVLDVEPVPAPEPAAVSQPATAPEPVAR